jgi:hypothetical protein
MPHMRDPTRPSPHTGPPTLDAEIVHGLSNHLAVILGFVEMVIGETAEDHPRRADLLEIRDAALAAAKLIGREPD